jgi:hypothetical protein
MVDLDTPAVSAADRCEAPAATATAAALAASVDLGCAEGKPRAASQRLTVGPDTPTAAPAACKVIPVATNSKARLTTSAGGRGRPLRRTRPPATSAPATPSSNQ